MSIYPFGAGKPLKTGINEKEGHNMSDKEKIKLQQWWMQQLRELSRKVIKEEEKRQAKASSKAEKILADFSSRDDIIEAYGIGSISERTMEHLLDMWDEVNQGGSEMYEAKIALLQEAYEEANRVLMSLE
jgi:hypothetical protein